ncbi:hypothetical protein [Dactylosporangium sp. NPDC000521]|uniref:hypothetical protein n=1 Tax=Dactylosporangium sp. NPDC000521 TaxID=3363975 RepID=UPI0036D0D6B2
MGQKDLTSPGETPAFGDSRDAVIARANSGGLEIKYVEPSNGDGPQYRSAAILFPNGREKRRIPLTKTKCDTLLQTNFEHWTILGEYSALLDKKEKMIEAYMRPTSVYSPYAIYDLPGITFSQGETSTLDDESSTGDDPSLVDTPPTFRLRSPDRPWVLHVESSGTYEVEFSPASTGILILDPNIMRRDRDSNMNRTATLKIRNVQTERHDDALALLEKMASSLFFEMDLIYGQLWQLAKVPQRLATRGDRQATTSATSVRLPRLQYATEAIALYEYGRAARGTPLLEYLAFYQVIEYFFPFFSRAETLRRMRRELADPRFDLHNDSHINQLLSIAGQSGRSSFGERDQLKDTIGAVFDDTQLTDFIKQTEDFQKFVTESRELKDVQMINLRDRGTRVAHQVADRVYDIRCRIVHTKEDGGRAGAKMMVPGSRESKLLSYDIALVRFLAQKTIIAGGWRAPW